MEYIYVYLINKNDDKNIPILKNFKKCLEQVKTSKTLG